MVHRINNSGTLVIDRRFRGIGRLKRATKIPSKDKNRRKKVKELNDMLTDLYTSGKHEIIKEIIKGRIHIQEVYHHYLKGGLKSIPSTVTLQPVIPTLPDWFAQFDGVSAQTRREYSNYITKMTEERDTHRMVGDTPIKDLPDTLLTYRTYCRSRGIARQFNKTRAAIQCYVNNAISRHSELYENISDIKPLKVTPKREGNPQTPAQLEEVLGNLWQLDESNTYADMAHSMAVTGMNWKEYASGKWEVLDDRVVIHGTKRRARERVVPVLDSDLVPAASSYEAFLAALKKASDNTMTVHDLRRSFMHWMEEARIPRTRRRMYLGHGSRDVTDRYERHEVTQYLNDDAAKMHDYIQKSIAEEKSDEVRSESVSSGL